MQHEQFDTKQPLFLQVVEVLTPQRDRLDAVLIFPSMPEVNLHTTFSTLTIIMYQSHLRCELFHAGHASQQGRLIHHG